MKLTVSKSKNSASFYVQKSIRRKDGTTTSVTVEKLGNIDEVRAKANGMDPYVWAQEYVNELNRKEYEEQKEIILSYSPSKLIRKDEQRTYNCGYLFLQSIYYDLGLDKICKRISGKRMFEYNLSDILSRLIYTRIIYPSSKLKSDKLSFKFIEQPSFELHDIYRALSVLSEESDFIQSELYKNSQKILERRKDILYYDCTNYFFEIEEEDELRRYGKSKQHQPLPIVGMGLFMDADGIPIAFDIFPGNKNEQPTLKPLEQKIIKDYGLKQIIVCTDAGLSSTENRKFNDSSFCGNRIRSYITTQSIKQLPEDLKEFALGPSDWKRLGDNKTYNIDEIDNGDYMDSIFYKDKWILEDVSEKKIKKGVKPLEQHLIVSYSPKYKNYQHKIRQGQIERAEHIISSGKSNRSTKNQNDPNRFIGSIATTTDGEVASKQTPYLKTDVIAEEEKYDGFYAVCTNIDDMDVEQIVSINKRRWEIEECFRIMKTEFKARPVYLRKEDRIKAHFLTCFISLFIYRILEKRISDSSVQKIYTCEEIISTLRDMNMYRPGEKQGYIPSYTRTDLTDRLHESAGFRTDYEILTDISMKKILRKTKKK